MSLSIVTEVKSVGLVMYLGWWREGIHKEFMWGSLLEDWE